MAILLGVEFWCDIEITQISALQVLTWSVQWHYWWRSQTSGCYGDQDKSSKKVNVTICDMERCSKILSWQKKLMITPLGFAMKIFIHDTVHSNSIRNSHNTAITQAASFSWWWCMATQQTIQYWYIIWVFNHSATGVHLVRWMPEGCLNSDTWLSRTYSLKLSVGSGISLVTCTVKPVQSSHPWLRPMLSSMDKWPLYKGYTILLNKNLTSGNVKITFNSPKNTINT